MFVAPSSFGTFQPDNTNQRMLLFRFNVALAFRRYSQ